MRTIIYSHTYLLKSCMKSRGANGHIIVGKTIQSTSASLPLFVSVSVLAEVPVTERKAGTRRMPCTRSHSPGNRRRHVIRRPSPLIGCSWPPSERPVNYSCAHCCRDWRPPRRLIPLTTRVISQLLSQTRRSDISAQLSRRLLNSLNSLTAAAWMRHQ